MPPAESELELPLLSRVQGLCSTSVSCEGSKGSGERLDLLGVVTASSSWRHTTSL